MAKFYGAVGFVETKKSDSPGVWEEEALERKYKGDVLQSNRRYEQTENLNSTLTVDNRISLVANAFLYEKSYAIRYVEWMGSKWQVTNIEIRRPRVVLTIGGLYNE